MKYIAIASASLMALGACATASDTDDALSPGVEQTRDEDGGAPVEEPAAEAGAADAGQADGDSGPERALACGDAGFCETRLPASQLGAPPSLRAVWSAGPNDVWSVSADGAVLHYDGTRWSRMKIGGLGSRRPDLTTVWTAGPGHVWVGGDGVLLSLGGKP